MSAPTDVAPQPTSPRDAANPRPPGPASGLAAVEAPPTSEFLASILDNAPDPVIALDLVGAVTFANAAAAELLERPVDELIGTAIADYIPCERSRARIRDHIRRRESEGERIEFEFENVEGTRWTSVSSRPLLAPDGQVAGRVVFLRDTTERHQAARALAAKNEELESYVSHVSHDLRSPLGSLLGFARLLRDDYARALEGDGLRFLDRIEQAGHTMGALIEDLLELSRIGGADEAAHLVDPLGVIQQVISDQKPLLDESDIEIHFPQQPPMLACNRTRLYQIFSNLIGNALVHMGPVDAPRVEIAIEQDGGFHHIRVADNGRGIAAEHHDKIFQVFSTLGRRADGRKPTGVGLAIVSKIAASYGGETWVESPPSGGAVFHVTLRAS